jgi:hypothetical protein
MANVNITIDGVVYSVAAGPPTVSVQDIINSTIGATPATTFGVNRHSLTVLTDTGGTSPSFLDVAHNTIQGHYLVNIRGGEVYATSSAPAASSGATRQ